MEKRKTINGEDILFAMTTLGFDNYVEPLKVYLQKYREATKGDNPPGSGTATGNGKTEPQGTIYEDQLFAIAATASSATTSDTPVIYSYTSTDQMQFQLSWLSCVKMMLNIYYLMWNLQNESLNYARTFCMQDYVL